MWEDKWFGDLSTLKGMIAGSNGSFKDWMWLVYLKKASIFIELLNN